LALAVAGALVLTGADLDRIIEIAREFEGVPGRMEVVSTDPMIIVDYAHTPDGMERVLKSMEGRKVVVFGAGGERDRGKRVKMGEVAGRLAQFVILTNDNPRCEPPSQIFADLVKGLEKVGTPYIIVPNRVEAIKMGVNLVKRWEWLCKREKGLERLEKFEREAERPIGVLFELEGEGVVIENRVELQLEVKREGREVKEWKRVEILKKGELPKLHPSPSSAPILFVLGKGREDYIEYCRRRVPYSDIQTIREVLKCMGAV
jgi:UDP-N-acetylmuramyl tripeptide synthase